MNPSYARLRLPLAEAMLRFAEWIGRPQLAPPRKVEATSAVGEACERGIFANTSGARHAKGVDLRRTGEAARGNTPVRENDCIQTKHGRIELVLGNIVEQQVDAIVNAANTKLLGGGGVDGAIHRAAGPGLLEQCEALPADENGRRCPTDEVRITGAGDLPARWVIHAVGPFYNERYAEKGRRQLHDVHERALAEAAARGCRSIAFPAISTGAYRFPIDEAASIALAVAEEHLRTPQSIELIRFVLFKPAQLAVFRTALEALSDG